MASTRGGIREERPIWCAPGMVAPSNQTAIRTTDGSTSPRTRHRRRRSALVTHVARRGMFRRSHDAASEARGVHRPRMPVRFEAGDHWRRNRRVGEAADCDPDDVRRDRDIPVHGRTALRAEAIRGAPAVAGAKRDRSPPSTGNVHVVDWPSIVTCSLGIRACTLSTLPVRFWHSKHWHRDMRSGSGPSDATLSFPQLHEALRVAIAPPVRCDPYAVALLASGAVLSSTTYATISARGKKTRLRRK